MVVEDSSVRTGRHACGQCVGPDREEAGEVVLWHWQDRRMCREVWREPRDCGVGYDFELWRVGWGSHKIVEGRHLKNNHEDSHSCKKRAAPVDAWPVSNPSRGGHHVKNGKVKFSQGSPCGSILL